MQPDGRPEPPAPTLLPSLALVLLAALVHLRVAPGLPAWQQGGFADGDGATRLLRILVLWHEGRWFDSTLPWIGAPEGLALHWTRPLDLLILLPALPVLLAGVAPETALYWSAALISPALHVIACLAAVWAARAIWPANWCWLAGIALLSQPAALSYSAFGRADHHALLLLACILGLGAAMRAAQGRPGAAEGAGIAFGIGIWVSPEALLLAVPALGALGLRALAAAPGAVEAGFRLAAAMAATIAVALPLERAPGMLLAPDLDRISVHHLAVAATVALVFAAIGRLPGRLRSWQRAVAGTAIASVGGAALLVAFPQMLLLSAAEAAGDFGPVFLAGVGELQPLRFGSVAAWRDAATVAGGVLAGAAGLAVPLLLRREATPAWRAGAPVAALTLLACLAATITARRFALDLAAPVALGVAGFVPGAVLLAERAGGALLRLPTLAAAAFLALFVPYAATPGRAAGGGVGTGATGACDADGLGRFLAGRVTHPRFDAPLSAPVLMADDINLGPFVAWRAGLRAVTGPYHQLDAAFADTQRAFGAAEAEVARAIFDRRGVGLVAVCAAASPMGGEWPAAGLRARLLAGDAPGWLREIPLPGALRAGGMRLYDVTR